MALIRFQCPACGAGLDDPGQGATLRCPYCSTSVVVPQELIAARASGIGMTSGSVPEAGGKAGAAVADSEILFEDDFSDPGSGWAVGRRRGGIFLAYTDGAYHISLAEDDSTWESFCDEDFSDFMLEVDVAKLNGPKDGEYGVTCRADDDGAYVFWLTSEGYYGICKIYYGQNDEEDDEYEDLVDGEERVLKPGMVFNRLGASCQGGRLSMWLNGKKVLEAHDDEFPGGDIGLMVTTGESGRGGLDVAFKNLVIKKA
jgi:hypothetical protein